MPRLAQFSFPVPRVKACFLLRITFRRLQHAPQPAQPCHRGQLRHECQCERRRGERRRGGMRTRGGAAGPVAASDQSHAASHDTAPARARLLQRPAAGIDEGALGRRGDIRRTGTKQKEGNGFQVIIYRNNGSFSVQWVKIPCRRRSLRARTRQTPALVAAVLSLQRPPVPHRPRLPPPRELQLESEPSAEVQCVPVLLLTCNSNRVDPLPPLLLLLPTPPPIGPSCPRCKISSI